MTRAPLTVDRHADVHVLHMDDGENRFNPDSIARLNAAIDEVEQYATSEADRPCALVTTGSGKFFSNGLDLDWMMGPAPAEQGIDPMAMIGDVERMWARILALPMPTIAAVNGHAFAGGAMFALTHDHVLMRADRGYWCVNEAILRMRFTPGMSALLTTRLTASTARHAMLTAHRFNGPAALDAGIVDALHDEDALLPAAIELAQSLAPTAHPVIAAIKEDLYADLLPILRAGAPPAPFD